MQKFKTFLLSIISMLMLTIASNSYSQAANNYAIAMQEIQREISSIPRYTPDDFPNIKDQIALDRRVSEDDLNNKLIPDEQQKKELIKYARAFRDRSYELANIKKKYAENSGIYYIKDILRKDYEITIENADNAFKIYSDGARNGISFGEINKNDSLNDLLITKKRNELIAYRENFLAAFSAIEKSYLEFNNCISVIAKKDDDNYAGYPEIIFIKIKNEGVCGKYKSTDLSAKTINDYLGQGKPLSINSKESENYKYDIEFGCSFGSFLGGIIMHRNGVIQVPDCVHGLGKFVKNYISIKDFYKKQNDAELAKQQAIKNSELQQVINSKRNLANKDPVARALNYSAGVGEDASGPNFFYPVDNSSGRCLYEMQSDNSTMGQISQSLMSAFAGMAPILGSAGVPMPNTATVFDLTKIDFSSITFYKINGTNPGSKYSNGTAYLKYQTKVNGLPDYFECDSTSCSLERLQRAWKLVAQNCKGTKKAF